MKTYQFRISEPLFDRLHRHLFPGDGDEHGAVITAGIAETASGVRFLARDVILAQDGRDFVPGKFGYRMFPADFVARISNLCAREKLCYFSAHSHGGHDSVEFSEVDLQSHRRGHPALLDITHGGPVGGLVFAENAVAGEIWTEKGVSRLNNMTIAGLNVRRLYPCKQQRTAPSDQAYHRQSLMFGDVGQSLLKSAKIGIIGLGGVGSLVNEYLARLGVGEILAIDFDRVEDTNLSRIVGSKRSDSAAWLCSSRIKMLRRLGDKIAKRKVHVSERVAKQANPHIRYRPIIGDVTERSVAELLRDMDFIFLCADSMQSRLVFNALVHHYLIPGIQIGSKINVEQKSGALENVFSVARIVLPEPTGGCLLCNELIPAAKLQEEALSEEERRRQAYVDEQLVVSPSVITLNALGSAQATNQFLLHFLGLFDPARASKGYMTNYSRENVWRRGDCRSDASCLHCGSSSHSGYGRGDRAHLPCKQS